MAEHLRVYSCFRRRKRRNTVFSQFESSLFQFLEELADRNQRAWFQANKDRYEREVREPALAFIRAFAPHLKKISDCFVASDQPVGGSLMRVYRDTRFAKDKTPYKTNVGIHFRHAFGQDVHAPGFYVHLAPGECFLALGVWRPDPVSLGQIRQAIVDDPDRWRRASTGRPFRQHFVLDGDCLKSPPRGFPADHPCVADLKRTDFVGLSEVSETDALAKDFLKRVATAFAAGRTFMRFLCEALQVPF
jgi:uncharacterized protein (TIGR02453 family)